MEKSVSSDGDWRHCATARLEQLLAAAFRSRWWPGLSELHTALFLVMIMMMQRK